MARADRFYRTVRTTLAAIEKDDAARLMRHGYVSMKQYMLEAGLGHAPVRGKSYFAKFVEAEAQDLVNRILKEKPRGPSRRRIRRLRTLEVAVAGLPMWLFLAGFAVWFFYPFFR